MAYDDPTVYTDGIIHGFVELITPPKAPLLHAAHASLMRYGRDMDRVVLQATTNGKVWSYALRPHYVEESPGHLNHVSPRSYIPPQCSGRVLPSRTWLKHPQRELVEWAVKDMARRAKLPEGDPGALQIGVAYEIEAPSDAGTLLPGPCGPIRYTGYRAKVGAYTIAQLHDIVVDTITACAPWAWQGDRGPWKPTKLEIMLHTGKCALGLAYNPGCGRDGEVRAISLNETLLKLYDAKSIWRVMVHELCHHYRDEVFARNDVDQATAEQLRLAVTAARERTAQAPVDALAKVRMLRNQQLLMQRTLETHDSIFVRELARIDEKVRADPYSGIVFTEYADASLVAVVQAKRAAKAAKIDWHPGAGRVWVDRLADGSISIFWVSTQEGGFKVKVGALSKPTADRLIANLGAAVGGATNPDMSRLVLMTAMTYSDRWLHTVRFDADANARSPNLAGFLLFVDKKFNLKVLSA